MKVKTSIKIIDDQINQLTKLMREGMSYHDFLLAMKRKEELEKQLQILIEKSKN